MTIQNTKPVTGKQLTEKQFLAGFITFLVLFLILTVSAFKGFIAPSLMVGAASGLYLGHRWLKKYKEAKPKKEQLT